MIKTVSSISSQIALMILQKRLEEGKEIEIPSLGIKILMKDGEIVQVPIDKK